MSLLNFPPEVSLQFIQKMNLVDRINLAMTYTGLAPLCFDRSLQRKSAKTLNINELRQLYEQSRTENERDQCFKSTILNRLLIKNFNEVVRLYMDPKNNEFVTNDKILHSLEGKFILEREKEKFSASFVEKFLCLLERSEGTSLLVFVDVEPLGAKNAKRCARILLRKLERGQKVYCISYFKIESLRNSIAGQIKNKNLKFTISYNITSFNDATRLHNLSIEKRNSVANTKELIDMINEDSLIEAKQHLGKVLALVEAAELPGVERSISCDNCNAFQQSYCERMLFMIREPTCSDCDGCALDSVA